MKLKLVVLSIALTSVSVPSFSQGLISGIFKQTNAAPVEDRIISPSGVNNTSIPASKELNNESIANAPAVPNNCIGYGNSWDNCAPVETMPVAPRINLQSTSLEPMVLPPLSASDKKIEGDKSIDLNPESNQPITKSLTNDKESIDLNKDTGNLTKEDLSLDLSKNSLPVKELDLNASKSFSKENGLIDEKENINTDTSISSEVKKPMMSDKDLMIAAYPDNIIRYTDKNGKMGFTNNEKHVPPGAIIEEVNLDNLSEKNKKEEKKSPISSKSKVEIKKVDSKTKVLPKAKAEKVVEKPNVSKKIATKKDVKVSTATKDKKSTVKKGTTNKVTVNKSKENIKSTTQKTTVQPVKKTETKNSTKTKVEQKK